VIGLELARDLGISVLKVFGDSSLVINQCLGFYRVMDPTLSQYQQLVQDLLPYFHQVGLNHVLRSESADCILPLLVEFVADLK
jgi:ribonuclease HI